MLTLTLPALLALATGLRQDPAADAPIVDERPELKAHFETLATHLKARGAEDDKAIAILDTLAQEFPKSGPKDRAAIVKEVAECFDVKRPKELQEGVPDDRLYQAAAASLGLMGPESVKPLVGLIGDKNHRKNLRLQTNLALSLGKTKSPDGLKTLLALLENKDAEMQAAGAEALGNFAQADLDTRKKIFEELLKILMGQKTKKDDPADFEAMDRWNMISGPFIATMQKVTGLAETDPDLWQRWWNDNKKKDWGAKG